jgi:hypothetical protein
LVRRRRVVNSYLSITVAKSLCATKLRGEAVHSSCHPERQRRIWAEHANKRWSPSLARCFASLSMTNTGGGPTRFSRTRVSAWPGFHLTGNRGMRMIVKQLNSESQMVSNEWSIRRAWSGPMNRESWANGGSPGRSRGPRRANYAKQSQSKPIPKMCLCQGWATTGGCPYGRKGYNMSCCEVGKAGLV